MAEKRRRIREIEADPNLSAAEKNQKKMEVLTGRVAAPLPSPAAAGAPVLRVPRRRARHTPWAGTHAAHTARPQSRLRRTTLRTCLMRTSSVPSASRSASAR